MPLDILAEIHNHTKLKTYDVMQNVLVVDQIPRGDENLPVEWLRSQVLKYCTKHNARILDEEHDVQFIEDTMDLGDGVKKPCYRIVILLDGWNHMHDLPDIIEHSRSNGWRFEGYDKISSQQYSKIVDVLASDSEEDGEGVQAAEEQRRKEEEEKKQLEKDVLTQEWACDVCTLLNPASEAICQVCATGRRPSPEQRIAAALAAKQDVQNSDEKKDEPKEPTISVAGESGLRLRFLARDLKKFIKVEQKRIQAQREQENIKKLEEMQRLKAEEEALKKAQEEEAKKLEDAGKPEEAAKPDEAKKPEEEGKPKEEAKKPEEESKPDEAKKPAEEQKH